MTLFFTLLPLYLVGNLHCIGMCGPLVMMIGKHQYRYWYFVGRILSFSAAAGIAGAFGSVLNALLDEYHLSALLSCGMGTIFLVFALLKFLKIKIYVPHPKGLQIINRKLASLMLQDTPHHSFLFGFSTVFLPCGQSMLVFSACALAGSALAGAFNGAAFALLTSPSLFVAMQAHHLLTFGRRHYDTLLAACSLIIGILAICRGFAELGLIEHLSLFPSYHIVIY